jgi:hypothetical protein
MASNIKAKANQSQYGCRELMNSGMVMSPAVKIVQPKGPVNEKTKAFFIFVFLEWRHKFSQRQGVHALSFL